jgi:hypothetical protein
MSPSPVRGEAMGNYQENPGGRHTVRIEDSMSVATGLGLGILCPPFQSK